MNRWIWFFVSAVIGLLLLASALLMPIHLRAVDAAVLQKAGGKSGTLIERGFALLQEKNLGAAQLLFQAAQHEKLPGNEKLGQAIGTLAAQQPGLVNSGGGASPRLEQLFSANSQASSAPEPITEFVVRIENRGPVLEFLEASRQADVQELLRARTLTNTAIFSPSTSASGQAFDAAISVTGLLLEEQRLSPQFRDSLRALAVEANRGGNSQPLEQALLDLMSLGQRYDWGQLSVFVSHIEDAETLRLLANTIRNEGQSPIIFSGVELSGQPAGVAKYLANFSQTGREDLDASLRFGAGGVDELLQRNLRLSHGSDFSRSLAATPPFSVFYQFALDCSLHQPKLAQALKWVLYFCAGFLLAGAAHLARPAASPLEQPLQVRGIHVAREILFAFGFLLVVLLLSEPFLAQESQKMDLPFRLHLPSMASAVPAGITKANSSIMNLSLLTLLLFFVLQGLLYLGSLVKLAEIRRQRVPSRIKLKLLENEDHLFDAGLYLGFAGTIVSLILVSMGVIKQPSIMAAYSSTSFGIIFVSIFKIFQLRPARRKLLLEAESSDHDSIPPAAAPALATPS